jgi:inner membrane protein
MDSVSQAALGAAVGEVVLGKKIGRKASILGAIVGTIPDLDVLILPFFNSLDRLSIHRGYSHSILVCVIGAGLLAFLFRHLKWTKDIGYARLFGFSFLALFTHVLLDAFTTYGTQLYLPFSHERVSWDSVNLVDPLYTIPLLIGLFLSAFYFKKAPHKKRVAINTALVFSTLYLLFTLWNKEQVEQAFRQELKIQNLEYQNLLTVPVKLFNVNWYGVAQNDKELYIGKFSRIQSNKIEFEKFPINDSLLLQLDPKTADIMQWFAKGFYTLDNQNGKIQFYNLQCDMQGIVDLGSHKAPTVFYFEMEEMNGDTVLKTGMHQKVINPFNFMNTFFPFKEKE